MLEKFGTYLWSRAKEPSSWSAVAAALAAIGSIANYDPAGQVARIIGNTAAAVAGSPDQAGAVGAVLTGGAAALGFFLKETQKTPAA
ncbi:hypothetical protein [Nitrospirillum iridis]|uniref:NADPH-dependent curcumin reductase CurA n=1 Tax=Nitrospirillum iridis TaxID=765888 RepID=A0A7X0B1N1_9PROT|nr:hypothetical protein [Nitrospirillum iridis]MBB6253045.1 NADPH-dependent curcumin reductase CurA [Nitrospirillum iridis]